jgi:hypothetical protein
MGKSSSTPAAPTLGGDIKDVLSALPGLYTGSSQFNPLFSSLNMGGLEDVLFGTEASEMPNVVNAAQAGWYDDRGNLISTDRNQYENGRAHAPAEGGGAGLASVLMNGMPSPGGRDIPAGVKWIGKGGTVSSGTRSVPASPGLIKMYGSATSGVRDAARETNPEMYALLDKLTSSASSDLALGNELSPEQMRLVQQSSRSGAAARGLGMGPADVFNETIAATGYGDELAQQRKAWAAQVLGLDKNFADTESGNALNLLGVGNSISSSNPINGLLGLAHDNSMTAYNAKASSNIASANNTAAIGGSVIMGGALIL